MIGSFTNKMPMESLETELKMRGYSKETIKSYLYYNKQFLAFIQKSPKHVLERDIKEFIGKLIDSHIDRNTINLAISSLSFYYTKVMRRKFRISRLKKEKKLYPVLSAGEVKRMLDSTENPKHRLLLEALYSTGLRVSEIARLKKSDIDESRNLGHVRLGKGKKDRLFTLSKRFVLSLRQHRTSNSEYIFSTSKGHYSTRTIQEICKKYSAIAGIRKKVTPHTFRRSFATHLIEKGYSIFIVQNLLGHSCISTTQEYIRGSRIQLGVVENPLDMLFT